MTLQLTILPQHAQNCNSHKPSHSSQLPLEGQSSWGAWQHPRTPPGAHRSQVLSMTPSQAWLLHPSREEQMAACPLTHPGPISLPFPVLWSAPISAGAEGAGGFSAQAEPCWPHPGPHPAGTAGRDNADVALCQQFCSRLGCPSTAALAHAQIILLQLLMNHGLRQGQD